MLLRPDVGRTYGRARMGGAMYVSCTLYVYMTGVHAGGWVCSLKSSKQVHLCAMRRENKYRVQ